MFSFFKAMFLYLTLKLFEHFVQVLFLTSEYWGKRFMSDFEMGLLKNF